MTDAADTADLAPPQDPAAYSRRRGIGAGVWLILLLCVVCLIAGGVGAIYAQRLLMQRAPGPDRRRPPRLAGHTGRGGPGRRAGPHAGAPRPSRRNPTFRA